MRLSLAMTSVLVATSLLVVPAVAAPLGAAMPKNIAAQMQNGDDTLVTPVQYRRGYRGGRTVDYCMRRFRSYDPNSGTYLGNDGYRHRCP